MRKVLSLLLALVMVIGMVPVTAFAYPTYSGVENLALAEGAYAYGINNDGSVIEPIAGRDDTMLAGCAIDGNFDNEAIPGAGHNAGWDLVVVLPEAVEGVNTIHYHGSKIAAQNAPNYSVWTSADGQNWELVKYGQEAPGTNDANTYVNNSEYREITFSNRTVKAVMFKDDTNCNFMRVAELEIYADPDVDIPANLAYGKPVKGYRTTDWAESPEQAQIGFLSWLTDGIKESYVYGGLGVYSSHAYDIDLGADYENVNKVVTSFVKSGNHGVPKNYGVAVKSSTDADWTVVSGFNPADNSEAYPSIVHEFNPRTVRYVRVQSFSEENAPGAERAMFISEIEAYQDPDVLYNHAYQKPVKLLHGANLSELPLPAENIGLVTDGMYGDFYYGSNGLWSWHAYEVDLGEEVADINTIKAGFIALGDGHGVPQDYQISVAGEDKVWYNVTTVNGAENPTGINELTFEFPNKSVRYILVRSTSEIGGRAMYIAEIKAFADPDVNIEEEAPLVNYARVEGVNVYARDSISGEHFNDYDYAGFESAKLEFINDGNFGNEAIPGIGHRRWDVYFELPEAVEGINNVKVYGSNIIHQVPPSCSILVSPDGIIWATVFNRVADDNSANAYTTTPSVIDAQFNAPFPVKFITFQDGSDQNFMRLAEVEIFANPEVSVEPSSNLAYFKPVTLLDPLGSRELVFVGHESGYSFDKRHITDGNPNTISVAAGSYQWQAQIDLGDVKTGVNTVKVTFGADVDNQVPLKFSVSVSEDGATWEKVATKEFESVAAREREVTLQFPNKNVKYVRVADDLAAEFNSAGAQIQMALGEVEVYADPNVYIEPEDNVFDEGNFAYGKPVSLYDGDLNPMVGPEGIEVITNGQRGDIYYGGSTWSWHTYVVDLQQEYDDINKVVTSFTTTADGHGVPSDYVIEVAGEDGVFTIVDSCCNNPANTANGAITIEHTFAATAVRYVRVRSLFECGGRAMYISEIEAYADPEVAVVDNSNLALRKDVKLMNPTGEYELAYIGNETSHANNPHHITDGNPNTISVAAGSYQWQAQIDLGDVKTGVNTVKVTFGPDADNHVPLKFSVSTSEDGATWKTVAVKDFGTVDAREREATLQFPNTDARYIRVADDLAAEFNSAGAQIQMVLGEVEVYADPNVDIAPPAVDATPATVTLVGNGTAVVNGWAVESWMEGDTVKVDVADAEGFTSTVTVNGEAYNAGDAIALAEGEIEVVVTTSASGYNTVTNTYTITVPAMTLPAVAEINGVGYATLADAVANAVSGDTIVLVDDITLDAYLNIDKAGEYTINLNGKSIARDTNATLIYVNNADTVLNITGEGTLTGAHIVYVNAGTANIYSGTYVAGAHAVYVQGTGIANVYGGSFSVSSEDSTFLMNKYDADRATTEINIYGGTFCNFNPADNAAEGKGTSFLPKGYVAVEADGKWTVEYAPTEKAPLPTVSLASATEGVVVTDVTAPSAENNYRGKGLVENWQAGAKVVFNVADAEGATSEVTINGEAYVPGSEYTMETDAPLTIVVTTKAPGMISVVKVYDVAVVKAGKATLTSVTVELNGQIIDLTDLDSTVRTKADALTSFIKGSANTMTIDAVAEDGATVKVAMRGATNEDSLTADLPYAAQFTAVITVSKAGRQTASYVVDIPVREAGKAPLESVVISGIGADVVVDAPAAGARTKAAAIAGFVKGEADTITITPVVEDGLEAVVSFRGVKEANALTATLPYASQFTATITVTGDGYQSAYYVIDIPVVK